MNSEERVAKQRWKIVRIKDGYDSGDYNTMIVTHKVKLRKGREFWTAYVKVHHWSSSRQYGPDFADIKDVSFEPRTPWGCKKGLTKLVLKSVVDWMHEEDSSLIVDWAKPLSDG